MINIASSDGNDRFIEITLSGQFSIIVIDHFCKEKWSHW